MKLRGIDFGPVLCASGAMGFFGEGYWHHKFLRWLGLDFTGCTFVAKTTTLNQRDGNMPFKMGTIDPKEFFPKCIKVYFRKGIMLNAVGLSGPGAKALFEKGKWQKRTDPFFLSFMSVASNSKERIAELEKFVQIFSFHLHDFQAKVGLQINYSCPNVGLNPAELVKEARSGLGVASHLDIPLMPKFNVLAPIEAVKEISDDPNCDAICVSNTIPWGQLPERINWKDLFGCDFSPLMEFGGGGLSGWPLLQLVSEWVICTRAMGISKPINAGGGILCPRDAETLFSVGASSVFIGSMATLCPWQVQRTIKRVHQLFEKGVSQ